VKFATEPAVIVAVKLNVILVALLLVSRRASVKFLKVFSGTEKFRSFTVYPLMEVPVGAFVPKVHYSSLPVMVAPPLMYM